MENICGRGNNEQAVKAYFDLNFLPKHEFTNDEIDEILNPAPNFPRNGVKGQETVSLMKDLFVKGQDVNFDPAFKKNYGLGIDYYRLNRLFRKIGDYVYDRLTDEEQLKYQILTEQKGQGQLRGQGIEGYRSLGYFRNRTFF